MPASQRLHHGEQGNQIYLGDREALPSLTLHYVQRAAVQGASLLPSIICLGFPCSPHVSGGASISRSTAYGDGRWGWIKKTPPPQL